MPAVEANGIEIFYESEGDGEPLLLVMGLAGQLIDWPEGLVDGLVAAGFRVIRYDNRDAGLSSETATDPPETARELLNLMTRGKGDAAYDVDVMADDAIGLLDALELGRVHIAGMSMGGMICQSMAIRYPHRVASLTSVMSHTGDRWSGRASSRVLARMMRLRDTDPARAAELNTEMFSLFSGSSWDRERHLERAKVSVARSYRPRGVAHQMAAVAVSPSRTAALGTVSAPTLVIHGLQDRLIKPSGGIATAKAVPGSRLLMFGDMGHDLPETRHGEIVEAVAANAARAPIGARSGRSEPVGASGGPLGAELVGGG